MKQKKARRSWQAAASADVDEFPTPEEGGQIPVALSAGAERC
jgi:hypothetical protein